MLLNLLEKRMLILEIFVDRLNLRLHMRQFTRRLFQATLVVILAGDELAAGIFQGFGHGPDAPIHLIKMLRRHLVVCVDLPGQRIGSFSQRRHILFNRRREMLDRLVLLYDPLAQPAQGLFEIHERLTELRHLIRQHLVLGIELCDVL
jgi:hypothetical protein